MNRTEKAWWKSLSATHALSGVWTIVGAGQCKERWLSRRGAHQSIPTSSQSVSSVRRRQRRTACWVHSKFFFPWIFMFFPIWWSLSFFVAIYHILRKYCYWLIGYMAHFSLYYKRIKANLKLWFRPCFLSWWALRWSSQIALIFNKVNAEPNIGEVNLLIWVIGSTRDGRAALLVEWNYCRPWLLSSFPRWIKSLSFLSSVSH